MVYRRSPGKLRGCLDSDLLVHFLISALPLLEEHATYVMEQVRSSDSLYEHLQQSDKYRTPGIRVLGHCETLLLPEYSRELTLVERIQDREVSS